MKPQKMDVEIFKVNKTGKGITKKNESKMKKNKD